VASTLITTPPRRFSEARTEIITLMIAAINTSETSFSIYRRNTPEDSHLHGRRHESLKPHHIAESYLPVLCTSESAVLASKRKHTIIRKSI
jgi:hypothetical protein